MIPERLRAAGLRVEAHDDHFGQDTADEDWLREVGRRGWIVLSRNTRIRYTSHETRALMEAGVAAFFLIGTAPYRELAENFVPRVLSFLEANRPPFIAKIYRAGPEALAAGKPGRVEMWLDSRTWRSP